MSELSQVTIARLIAEHAHHMEMLETMDHRPVYVSPSSHRVMGHNPEEFIGNPDLFASIIHAESRGAWENFLMRIESADEPQYVELRLDLPDRECWLARQSHVVFDEANVPIALRSTIWDITPQKQLEHNLARSNRVDSLTGLPNRMACLEQIQYLLELERHKEEYNYAVVYIDIDRLKIINDSMGPSCGDELIRQFAQRIEHGLVGVDYKFSHLSGDEFVVILDNISARGTIRLIKIIQKEICKPFRICNTEIMITASMGIVLSPALYDAPEDMLRNANIAMRRAKEQQAHRFKVFHSRLLEEAIKQTEIERDMPAALKNGEFQMHYQPIVDLESKKVTGVEALLRWQHPKYGLLPPAEFLPVAESNDFIVPLGEWALRQSCKDMVSWQKANTSMRSMTVSVNLSARQLARHDVVTVVSSALEDSGLPPESLKLEITETVAMENPELTTLRLELIKKLGVGISIDDFGTGYSSLSYLQSFPIDTIKVDKRFVGSMNTNSGKRKIVRSVINLAHNLDLNVVAEGVEESEHWSMLRVLDCECAQGFYFSRPVTAEEILRMVRDSEDEK